MYAMSFPTWACLIQVKRKWLNNAGTDIIAHVADCLK